MKYSKLYKYILTSVSILALLLFFTREGHEKLAQLMSFLPLFYIINIVFLPIYIYRKVKGRSFHILSNRATDYIFIILSLISMVLITNFTLGNSHKDCNNICIELISRDTLIYAYNTSWNEEGARGGLVAILNESLSSNISASLIFAVAHFDKVRKGSDFFDEVNIILTKFYIGFILYMVIKLYGIIIATMLHTVIDSVFFNVNLPSYEFVNEKPEIRILFCLLIFASTVFILFKQRNVKLKINTVKTHDTCNE